MKKILFILISCLLLTSCGKSTKETVNESETVFGLKNPELDWCELYETNGVNTVTCSLYNSNDVSVDVTYDLVYYDGKKEVSRSNSFSSISVSSKNNDIVWSNANIPSSKKIDSVKLENVSVTESHYKSINCEYKNQESNDKITLDIECESKPVIVNAWVLLYNDKNKNDKVDENELVTAKYNSSMKQKDTLTFETTGYKYNNYAIYYSAH